jgi:hypothetical protein
MDALPVVVEAAHLGGYLIALKFADGTNGTVDFENYLDGPVFEPLRDEKFFSRFFIEAGTLAWPNGADIAPETLYERTQAGAAA